MCQSFSLFRSCDVARHLFISEHSVLVFFFLFFSSSSSSLRQAASFFPFPLTHFQRSGLSPRWKWSRTYLLFFNAGFNWSFALTGVRSTASVWMRLLKKQSQDQAMPVTNGGQAAKNGVGPTARRSIGSAARQCRGTSPYLFSLGILLGVLVSFPPHVFFCCFLFLSP